MMHAEQTLGQLVTTNPAAAKVLHRYHLDFCCGGQQSLTEACTENGLDPNIVLQDLAAAQTDTSEELRWDRRPLPELVQHILERYHMPLRAELPRLVELSGRVDRAHAGNPARPEGLTDLLANVQEAVEGHLDKEEHILFPLILSGQGRLAHMPVQVMITEHEDHGENLRRIREITRDFVLPAEACASWRELYRSLAQLEAELMDHIHLENHILFPRALVG